MRWYFASRKKHKQTVGKIIEILKENNQDIIFDWAKLRDIKPYKENRKLCSELSNKISLALSDVEIFVLISDKEGTDMFIELGIAIANWLKNKSMRIYIVGKWNKRSLMHFHPAVIHVNDLKEVFYKECPDIAEKLDLI